MAPDADAALMLAVALLLAVVYIDLVSSLVIHNFNWRISRMENSYPKVLYDGVYHILEVTDPGYVAAVGFGATLTLFGLVAAALFFYYRIRDKLKPDRKPQAA